jgi:hypothetical protein
MSDKESLFLEESPIYQGAGATVPYSVTFPFATTVAAGTIAVYKNGADVTSTVMPSGSHSASGNVLTLKPLTALTGGETYLISIAATVDGVADQWFCEVKAVKTTTGKM